MDQWIRRVWAWGGSMFERLGDGMYGCFMEKVR